MSAPVPPPDNVTAVAFSLARAGLHVFPFFVYEDGKKFPPSGFDWTAEATTDPERIADWWGFAGQYPNAWPAIHCGKSGLLVVDVDQNDGKDGQGSILAAGLDLPITETFPSRRGGRHHYYRAPAGVPLTVRAPAETVLDPATGEVGPLAGVDIRAGNGLVVYYNGELSRETIAHLHFAPAPAWAVDAATDTGRSRDSAGSTATVAEWVAACADPEGTPTAHAALRALDISASGTDHGTMITALMALVRFAALGEPGVPRLVRDARARYLAGPYDTRVFQTAFDNALSGAIREVGVPLAWDTRTHTAAQAVAEARAEHAAAVEHVVAEARPERPEPLASPAAASAAATPSEPSRPDKFQADIDEAFYRKRVNHEAELIFRQSIEPGTFEPYVSMDALEALDVPSEPIVEGLLYPGTVVLWSGTGSTGKTTALLGIAMAMGERHASGAWLGRKVKRGRVLFIEGEGAVKMPGRVRAWAKHYGDDYDASHIRPWGVRGRIGASALAELRDLHVADPYDLIVIDTVSAVLAVKNENDNSEVAAIMREVRGIVDANPQACIVLVHHTTNSKDDKSGRITFKTRGASAWRDNADTVVMQTGSRSAITISTDPEDNGKQRNEVPTRLKGLTMQDSLGGVVIAAKSATEQSGDMMKVHSFLAAGFPAEAGRGVGQAVAASQWQHASGFARAEYERLREVCVDNALVSKDPGNHKAPFLLTHQGFDFLLNPLSVPLVFD